MSFLIDTNLISLCHKKHLPAKFKAWLRKNEANSFISSVTIAEMRYGVELADATQKPLLTQRITQTEVDFAEAGSHQGLGRKGIRGGDVLHRASAPHAPSAHALGLPRRKSILWSAGFSRLTTFRSKEDAG